MRFLYVFLLAVGISLPLQAANLTERLSEVDKSKAAAEQFISSLQNQALTTLTAEDYLVLSVSYQTVNNRDAALDAASKAEQLATTPFLQALSLFHKAQIHGIYFQNADMAIQQLLAAEQLLLNHDDQPSLRLLNDVLRSFASAYNLLGQLAKGLEYAERSLALARQLGEPSLELASLIISGRLALQDNQYQRAFYYLQQGLTLANALQDFESLASIHFRLGMAFRKLDLHQDALEHFQQAAERYRTLDLQSNYTHALIYLAETYLEEPDQAEKAQLLLEEARQIAEQQQHLLRIAMVNYSLARTALVQHQFAPAEQLYQLALQQFRQINSSTYIQEIALALVRLYIQQQRYPEAEQFLVDIAPDIDAAATYLKLRFYNNTADLAAARQQWQAAYQAQQQAMQLAQQEQSEQLKSSMAQLKGGLIDNSQVSQQAAQLEQLQQQLAAAESRQVLLQLLLVGLIFTAFVIWQLYRRQLPVTSITSAPEPAPKQWGLFREKVKQANQRAAQHLVVLLPRNRTQLQQKYGRRCVSEVLEQVRQQLNLPEVTASFSGSEMLWLCCDDEQKLPQLLQQATALLEQKLAELGANPELLTLNLPLQELLGEHWQKEDLNGLAELVWLCWYLAGQQLNSGSLWQLAVHSSYPRPCEWQADNLRADMLNALKLGELTLELNGNRLSFQL